MDRRRGPKTRHLTGADGTAPRLPSIRLAERDRPAPRVRDAARGRRVVFAAVRRYAGLERSVVDDVAAQAAAICSTLDGTPGSRGCEVISTREGLIVVALGDDESSVIELGRRFVAWVDHHVPALRGTSPEVWAGEVLVHGHR